MLGFCCILYPMFIFFITCVTLVLFSNSLSFWLVGLTTKRSEILLRVSTSWKLKVRVVISYFQTLLWSRMDFTDARFENVEKNEGRCLLGLPDLPLHFILDKLSPDGLCSMAAVCTSMRGQCTSDYYWEKYLREKWGRILGKSAYKEWQCYVVKRNRSINLSRQSKQSGWFVYILNVLSCYLRKTGLKNSCVPRNELRAEQGSMALYLALESGKFWFPAQVYNRENGHAGFLLSCYDAKVRYELATNTFHARYSPHGRQTLEENIEWERIRAPAVDIPSNSLFISDCLAGLQPGDHIEIQWRRNKEFPYGWWYGVVGHMETCDRDANHCHCHQCDMVVLEFKQYAQGSRWRKKMVKRDSHREEGDAVDGFYGGIKKLYKNEEISTWKRLWPSKTLH